MPTKLVIDSSVVVKWLNQKNEQLLHQADNILHDIKANKAIAMCPELVKYEAGNALLRKSVDESLLQTNLKTLYALPLNFVKENEQLAKKSIAIAHQHGITYYDACFLSLAEQLSAKLVTANPKHQGKYQKVDVIPLSQYQ